ncbi:hypothetical protein L6452_04628 [Arctium lappa]|uniref:Uncharacterized protein n=1 Tax=Arctium lappa TaxID=4217 RepID=A0ACB9EE20_ARCLA|nr:hypothetical protein L6452_04628 [Arctium lappa]
MSGAIRRRTPDQSKLTLTGFLHAFKVWILETFPAATRFFTMHPRLPRGVRWTRIIILGSKHVGVLLDTSEHSRPPIGPLMATPQEEAFQWYQISHRYFQGMEEQEIKRTRVSSDGDDDDEGDDDDDDDGGVGAGFHPDVGGDGVGFHHDAGGDGSGVVHDAGVSGDFGPQIHQGPQHEPPRMSMPTSDPYTAYWDRLTTLEGTVSQVQGTVSEVQGTVNDINAWRGGQTDVYTHIQTMYREMQQWHLSSHPPQQQPPP